MTKQSKIIFVLIILIGLLVRLYQLGAIPGILNRDEAGLAYNAYLLSETGKDEWGKSWPLFLQSFGDYKLPGYVISLVALFKFFPLTDLVVRLPSMLAGVGLIAVGFYFARKEKLSDLSSLFVSASISLSAIFIFYSRIAFEANLALFIFSFALLLLFFTVKSRVKIDLLSLFLILLSVLTYNTPLILLPFIIIILPFVRGVKDWRNWLLPVVGMCLIFISIYSLMIPLTAQKGGITIFSDETVWRESVIYRENFSGVWQKILGNKYFYFGQIIIKNIANSFTPRFLITNGGTHPWHALPDFGHIFWVSYVLFWVGIIDRLKILFYNLKKKNSKNRNLKKLTQILLPIYLLLISLVPAVITVDAPHATRSLLFFVMLMIISGFGFERVVNHFKNKKIKTAISVVLFACLIFSSLNYLVNYFISYNLRLPDSLNVSFRQVIQEAEVKYPLEDIAIVDEGGYDYILLAWYLKIDPIFYLENNTRQLPNTFGFNYGERVGRYHFIANQDDRTEEEKVLIKGSGYEWEILEY